MLSVGPFNYTMVDTFKLGLCCEPPKSNLSKGLGGFYSPPGEGVVRRGCGCQSGVCVGAVSGGAARGRTRLDAVNQGEMVDLLYDVEAEVCKDACCVESCFLYEYVRRLGAESEEGSETLDGGYVRSSTTAHDNGENINIGTSGGVWHWREAYIHRESSVLCGSGYDICNISIPLYEYF
jgi:hypothetical protein